jgi:hypothetical protein
MVRKMDDLGGYYHEPPYTEEEIAEQWRRVSGGPIAWTRPSVKKPQLPEPQEQERRELKR